MYTHAKFYLHTCTGTKYIIIIYQVSSNKFSCYVDAEYIGIDISTYIIEEISEVSKVR